jgi:osmotically-inducible protein OsmY
MNRGEIDCAQGDTYKDTEVMLMVAIMEASTDFELGREVFLYLKRLPELSADDLSVKSDGEIVTIEGFVKCLEERRVAEKAALEVYGVKAVANEILVKFIPERADTEIAKDILHKFRSQDVIPIEEVKTIVSNGLVTLEGSVHSQFEKMLAEAAVKSVRGVTGIRNDIEVKIGRFSPEVAREAEDTTTPIDNREAWTELGAAEAG